MKDNEKEKWDRAAVDYQRVFSLGLNQYNKRLLRFWHEEGMLSPGCRILDIGCGVGKYGTYLARLGYDVTLTDISGEMLQHAQENMREFDTPWAVYRGDFNEVTGKENVFADGFDLVISTMSPAIHDIKTVKVMSGMSRNWCFLARFRDWEQPSRDSLMRKLGMEPRHAFDDLKGDVDSIIFSVKDAGYRPQVKIVDYNWSDSRTPEQMAEYLCRNYFSEEEAEHMYTDLFRTAERMRNTDGCIEDSVNTRVAWIYWKAGENA